jgi:hypothetical protein
MSETDLENTVVYRCGRTAKTLNHETKRVRLETLAGRPIAGKTPAIRLFFTIDSKGGGKTEIYVDVHEGDFAAVVAALVEVSAGAALPPMAAAVAQQLADQPKRDARLREEARAALVAKAKEILDDAPHDRDDVERLVYKGVAKIAADVRDAETKRDEDEDSAA